ncbi:MAG TPA: hybrid sensor histidine kinase/response regulator [Polyangia bacterium]|nr:hybrid sensor histidine kinase/response regulator [Polyangia bacterium]
MSAGPVETPATILVVDDNLQNREVAEGHLVGAGYRVVQAEGGAEALAILTGGSTDLVLLDVLMPGMDGYETCRRIRALPRGGDVPVLFLTALGDLETHRAAMESGADDFLTKPLNRTELLIRVRSLLRIKQLSDELRSNYEVIRTQRDALLAAQRQKDELTALIVHDLKNPLSSILSNTQFVLGGHVPDREMRDSLEDVVRASQAMVRLVMNLLDISRSEDGALVPHVSEFALPDLLAEVRSEMDRRIQDKQQCLSLTTAPGVGALRGDRELLRRTIENLIDNAYKYGPRAATIWLEVTTATMDDGAEPAVEIRVRDEGDGIPEAYRQIVFEKYGRAATGAREARSSHGLGLVFCRRAVDVHGGAIWIEGEEGRGACFCVRLPTARLPLSAPDPGARPRTGQIEAAVPVRSRAVR